jgi:hypothetical protein
MEALLRFSPFALEGQWHGAAAVALVVTGVIIFIGTIYVLLVAIYGWWQGYLVTMISLMAFSIILAMVWLVGIPGTIPGTGPRGTEPTWVMFLADSEQGLEFSDDIKAFPAGAQPAAGWRKPDGTEQYPGEISPDGELENIKRVLQPALAGYFQQQKTGSSDPTDYNFVSSSIDPAKLTPEEKALPKARIFFKPNGDVKKINAETKEVIERFDVPDASHQLLVGIDLPRVVDKDGKVVHPAIRVFGYRNKGQVFMASAQWLGASVILFALHLWWLARFEKKQKAREADLARGVRTEPAPV